MSFKYGIHDTISCAHAAKIAVLCNPMACACNCHSIAYPFAKVMDKLIRTKTSLPPANGYGPMSQYYKRTRREDEDDSGFTDSDDDPTLPEGG